VNQKQEGKGKKRDVSTASFVYLSQLWPCIASEPFSYLQSQNNQVHLLNKRNQQITALIKLTITWYLWLRRCRPASAPHV